MNKPHADLRTPGEVARRVLALFGAWGLTTNAPREEILSWLQETDLRRDLTDDELRFVDEPSPTKQAKINFSWHAERIAVLLWSLRLLDELPEADTQCDTSMFQDLLPPFAEETLEAFVNRAGLRPERELLDYAQTIFDLHAWARNPDGRKMPVNIEVVQERHYAINWVTGYEGLAWDEVTTDT